MGSWLQTPPGRYLLDWEQDRLDHAVADVFGYHALQIGLPEVEGLRANRMPHRWVATDTLYTPEALALPPQRDSQISTLPPPEPISLHSEYDALPFPSASIDLVVLPHALELARDPHETVREVERVLVPVGRFGCWRPPLKSESWLERFAWMDGVGDRWWPVLGSVYFLVAVKRVRGMRLVGLARQERRKTAAAPAVVANRHQRHRGRADMENRAVMW